MVLAGVGTDPQGCRSRLDHRPGDRAADQARPLRLGRSESEGETETESRSGPTPSRSHGAAPEPPAATTEMPPVPDGCPDDVKPMYYLLGEAFLRHQAQANGTTPKADPPSAGEAGPDTA